MKKLFFVFIFLSAFIAEGQTLEARVKEFDAYIEKSRILFQIPGISVAVVKDGKVLLSKGYGVRAARQARTCERSNAFCLCFYYQSYDSHLHGHVGR
jgi:CubicO group peptidase (beta-lactamase class C family)